VSRGGHATALFAEISSALSLSSSCHIAKLHESVVALAWLRGISVHDISWRITIAEISLIYRVIVRPCSSRGLESLGRFVEHSRGRVTDHDGMTNWFPLVRSSDRPCRLGRKPRYRPIATESLLSLRLAKKSSRANRSRVRHESAGRRLFTAAVK